MIFTGFLCGKCNKGLDDTGIALNLIECVSCNASDIAYFVLLCELIMLISQYGILHSYMHIRNLYCLDTYSLLLTIQ